MSIDINQLSPAARQKVFAEFSGKTTRRSKYGAVKERRGKIVFDSRKEAARFDELMILQRAGQIRKLCLQVQYTLKESYVTPEGERMRAIRYVADFAYEMKTSDGAHWVPIVEDVKSKATRTKEYATKKKMMYDKFGILIQEV